MNIKDIARLAGVSPATVSKVIHQKDEAISAATRAKVLAVIEEHKYQPYKEIIREHERRSGLLAVVTDMVTRESMLLINELTRAFARAGFALIVLPYSAAEAEGVVASLRRQHVEAVIALTSESPALLAKLTLEKIPVLALNATEEGMVALEPVQAQTASAMTAYILALGHRSIVAIGDDGALWQRNFEQVLHAEGASAGRVMPTSVLAGSLDFWLTKECTAVLCSDMRTARAASEVLRRHGLRVPQDISVASLTADGAELLAQSITAMAINYPAYAGAISRSVLTALGVSAPEVGRADALLYQLQPGDSTAIPASSRRGKKIVAIGSINMDCSIYLPHLPAIGENLTALQVLQTPGGKGANQAVGVARLGAEAYLIGAVGRDAASRTIFNDLQKNHVHRGGIIFDGALDTGTAYINVSMAGESSIVIAAGANSLMDAAAIEAKAAMLAGASFALISTEIPLAAVTAAINECERRAIPVILKPANIESLPPELLTKIDYLVPSRRELELLVPNGGSLEQRAKSLIAAGVKNVIVTLGASGCLLCTEGLRHYFPAMDIEPVDTTGGADAFISALAVYLSEGMELATAIGFATYNAGLCVAGHGVQPAMPLRARLEAYREEIIARFVIGGKKNE